MTPEARARQTIDTLLTAAGWAVCHVANANIHAATGVAIREFPLNPGHGFADYLLYVNGKACGVIEAKKEGATLSGVEVQSARYAQGLPAALPAWRRPLPFVFEPTGVETRFTNGLDPQPRARALFAFFRPELLVQDGFVAQSGLPGLVASWHDRTQGRQGALQDHQLGRVQRRAQSPRVVDDLAG
ncbi:MAG: type I restriction enzyme R subunit [Hydrogenophaga sp.]|jgi:type I restriction enzyme R subunit